MTFTQPLQAHAVGGDVFVCDPDGGSDILMTPEAVLDSLERLRVAALQAMESRQAPVPSAA